MVHLMSDRLVEVEVAVVRDDVLINESWDWRWSERRIRRQVDVTTFCKNR